MIMDIVIVSAVRTPIGSFNGVLSPLSAPQLGSLVIAEAIRKAGLQVEAIDEVIMGNVLTAGLGQAPARQAALGAGLPKSVGTLTINKVCGSGLKAVMLAAQAIRLGDAEIIVAGGMESMSNTPYLLEKARRGYRMGHGQIVDSMIKDGLWDVYNNFHMGSATELCATKYKLSREEVDQFAITSYIRALEAQRAGAFKDEIIPIRVNQSSSGGKGTVEVTEDEELAKFDRNKIASLKPIFQDGGTVTAANASSISDGAAAVVVMSSEKAKAFGISPLVKIIAYSSASQEPEWFTTAPVLAIKALLRKTDHKASDIDLFEINEAFSTASLAVNRELELDPKNVNVRGGAVALGHPIGASGARVLTTLIHAMKSLNKRRGVASLCIGGGEAVAMMVEG
ncbi:MAG: thiolase family protein [Nitrospiria bacterium]